MRQKEMEAPLIDGEIMEGLSSKVNYLRLSITDRCNLRCFYCTYWQDWEKLPATEILSYEELLRLAAVASRVGLRKIRITGGEPLMRRGVPEFIRRLRKIPGIDEVCLTTNGVFLTDLAPALDETGLRHLNVSLDTLKPHRYLRITGRDNLDQVLAGLERVVALGFQPVKINCVALKGINDDELLDLALLARKHPFQMRFIELMPMASPREWQTHFMSMAEVRQRLAVLGEPVEVKVSATAGPARICKFPGWVGEVGFISPMTEHHCGSCNRLRLTAQGRLRPCLLTGPEFDLKKAVRQDCSDAELASLFHEAMRLKDFRPENFLSGKVSSCHSMATIGG